MKGHLLKILLMLLGTWKARRNENIENEGKFCWKLESRRAMFFSTVLPSLHGDAYLYTKEGS